MTARTSRPGVRWPRAIWQVTWATFLTLVAAAEIAWASWPWAALVSAACLFAIWNVVRTLRGRGPAATAPAKRDLALAVKSLRRDGLYLARDAHVVLMRHRLYWWSPVDCVDRYLEGDLQEFAEEGSAIVTHVCFRLTPDWAWGRVVRRQEAMPAELGEAGPVVKEGPSRSRRAEAKGAIQVLRVLRSGAMFADKDEMRELAAQIKTAELLAGPGEKPPESTNG